MVLNSIIDGTLTSQINVLQETKKARASPFLKSFLNPAAIKCQSLHLICFQEPPEFYRFILPSSAKVFFYDVFTDPIGWTGASKSHNASQQSCSIGDDFFQLFKKNCTAEQGGKESVCVIFDGLSMLIRKKGVHYVCSLINSFRTPCDDFEVTQVIAVAENELLSEVASNALKYIANSFIELSIKDTGMKYQREVVGQPLKYKVDVTVKKTTGKVVREVGIYYFTKDCELVKFADVIDSKSVDDANDDQTDPAANLPFNLKLTDSEKMARSQVKLPYMLGKEEKAAQLDGPPGRGMIFYQPDDADDFDEEDPDDDLDI